MCWQDWKIGAQTRQKRFVNSDGAAGFGIEVLPANNRRMGIVIHGPVAVEIRTSDGTTNRVGHIVASAGITGAPADVWPNIGMRSTVLSVAEFGNDLRGALRVDWVTQSNDQYCELSELEWCGPESLDGGL